MQLALYAPHALSYPAPPVVPVAGLRLLAASPLPCRCLVALAPQVRLVLELCDMGTLQELLRRGAFRQQPGGQPDMAPLLATASDVVRAMHHLHTTNIIHGDLKVCCVWGGSWPAR